MNDERWMMNDETYLLVDLLGSLEITTRTVTFGGKIIGVSKFQSVGFWYRDADSITWDFVPCSPLLWCGGVGTWDLRDVGGWWCWNDTDTDVDMRLICMYWYVCTDTPNDTNPDTQSKRSNEHLSSYLKPIPKSSHPYHLYHPYHPFFFLPPILPLHHQYHTLHTKIIFKIGGKMNSPTPIQCSMACNHPLRVKPRCNFHAAKNEFKGQIPWVHRNPCPAFSSGRWLLLCTWDCSDGFGCWVVGVGYCVLGLGYWMLDVGYWTLGIGPWTLGLDRWLWPSSNFLSVEFQWRRRSSDLERAVEIVSVITKESVIHSPTNPMMQNHSHVSSFEQPSL